MRVTETGQVTIPRDVRQALGIRAGTEVAFVLDQCGARLIVGSEGIAAEIGRRVRYPIEHLGHQTNWSMTFATSAPGTGPRLVVTFNPSVVAASG